ncbi:hypothetical protein LT85_3934 [Collimonas arenae]|uniref:PAAR motif family protein n=1 Tax=Collimonas arenae TaxID=279058 RepID=A0A0A1FJL4_9BURK|nr:hypothetical protein LT85_3934 [Collimonas arenae]
MVDDLVSCPLFYDEARTKPHGINRIIEGIEGYTDNGRKMVVNGCHSECGCVVISQSPGMTIA